MKLNLPAPFKGDPHIVKKWVKRMEFYFRACALRYQGVHRGRCMFIGVANLDGVALQWYERLDDDD